MPRISPLGALKPVLMCALVVGQAAFAKNPEDPLAPTRSRLEALESCLGPSDALKLLSQGLLTGWHKKPADAPPTLRDWPKPPPPPPDYLASLDRDIRACSIASQLRDENRQAILASVRKDIEVKADDCHTFGMGRRVSVSITTLRGATTEHGWQVFYKWSCASPLQPAEVRVPNLTSPANVDLPPGVYSVRAEKRTSPSQVETIAPVTVVVGSAQSVPIQLAIQ